MKICKKCENPFEPCLGLVNYCSMKCRQGKKWTDEDKKKKSDSARKSLLVIKANEEEGKKRRGNPFPGIRYDRTGKSKKGEIIVYETSCKLCKEKLITNNRLNKKYHKECWLQIAGGYREGSSRGKSGWYKGIWCDSSWELVWVIYQIDHNIEFKRNKHGFEYIFENKKRKYYPDFILESGNVYIEIKNYDSIQFQSKIKYFPNELKVLYKKDLTEMFEYVISQYGKNFIELYDKKDSVL